MSGGSSIVRKRQNHPDSIKFFGRRSYTLETVYVREHIDKLRKIQKDLDEIKVKFYDERRKLEVEMAESCEPLYLQRYDIVNGVVKDATNQEDKMKRGVPNFWLYALKGHDSLAAQITDQDEEALKHLTDIKWSRIQKGFMLEFHFNTNPFFENPALAKTYHMNDEDEFFLESSIGTKITWRPGKCLTQKPSTNKSFFGLFSPPEIPMNLKDTKNTVVVTNLKYEMENDCFLGLIIRDEIIPRALLWFTGEAGLEQKTQISAQRSNFLKNLSKDVKECVESLRSIQEKYDAFKAKFDKDRASIQAEYCQSCQPLYVERYNIVNDEAYEDNIDHEAEGESMDHETDETSSDSEEKALLAYEKEVPNFWLYALQNNDYIDDEITYRDELALEFLKDIKCSPIECFKGFKLDFYFRANPFFENSVLTKTYFMSDEGRSIVKDITGTKIKWYPTRCLTQIPIRKKPETGSEYARSITTFEDYDSFFSFFNALEVDDIDKRIEQMQHDFTIGSIIRHQIIPHAVSWFTGEAIEKDVCSDDEDQYLGLEYKFEDIDEGQDAYEDLDDGLEYDYEHEIEIF